MHIIRQVNIVSIGYGGAIPDTFSQYHIIITLQIMLCLGKRTSYDIIVVHYILV